MEHIDLVALADFNLVALHGGFGKAARAARRPKATLSRRVADLEAQLQLRLFERGGRLLRLTEEGLALHRRSSALLTEIDEVAAAITSTGSEPRGRLKISAPLLFSQMAMGTIAAKFVEKFPAISLEVTSDDREVDLVDEGYDLAIRVNPKPDESLVGRAFLHDQLVVVGHPKLRIDRRGVPIPVVRRSVDPENTWTFKTTGKTQTIAVQSTLTLSSLMSIRDAVRTGVGLARLPLSLVSTASQTGQLKIFGEVEETSIAIWALYPSRRLLNPRVSAFLDFLRSSFPNASPDELAAFINS